MSNNSVLNSPNNPKNQPFNVSKKPCKSKVNSWWNPHGKNYWRTKGNKKTNKAFTQGATE